MSDLSLTDILLAAILLASVTAVGLLTAIVVAIHRYDGIIWHLGRIETWTCDLLRAVDPANPSFGGCLWRHLRPPGSTPRVSWEVPPSTRAEDGGDA